MGQGVPWELLLLLPGAAGGVQGVGGWERQGSAQAGVARPGRSFGLSGGPGELGIHQVDKSNGRRAERAGVSQEVAAPETGEGFQ